MDVSQERRIIRNLIVNPEFLQSFHGVRLHFETEYARVVSKWCLQFYTDFQTAPGPNIESIFLTSRERLSKDVVEVIGRFLKTISDEFSEDQNFNLEYEIQKAIKYFQERSIIELQTELETMINTGNYHGADHLISNFKTPELGVGIGTDFVQDTEALKRAFSEEDRAILRYPGYFGQVVPGLFASEVSALIARTGLGKTWFMIWTAMYAASLGIETLLVSLEMEERDVLIRAWMNRLKVRGPEDNDEYVKVPSFKKTPNDDYVVDQNEIRTNQLSLEKALKDQEGLRYLWQDCNFKLWTYPARTLKLTQLESDLERAERRENFRPKLILIDYPAMLDFTGNDDYRLRVINVWVQLKQLAAKKKVAILGALQVTGDKLKAGKKPDLTSVPEAKDISSHVANMFALWDSKTDENRGLMRASTLKSRHSKMSHGDAVIAYCHTLGQAYIDSKPSSQVNV